MKRSFIQTAILCISFLMVGHVVAQTDVTASYMTNPDFENGATGWIVSGMVPQTNNSFTKKNGNTYMEKWVGESSRVGDASISATIKGLPTGSYTLKVAAQNIMQSNLSAQQSGACVFADDNETKVTTTADYSVDFIVIDGVVNIGFKAVGATGNWLSCDNFRLVYNGDAADEVWTEFALRIENAKSLVVKKMGNTRLSALNAAISTAEITMQNKDNVNISNHAMALREAVDAAAISVKEYETLQAAIDAALLVYDASLQGTEAFDAVINEAKLTVENLDADSKALTDGVLALEKATLQFRLDNATGTIPTVVTDTRYARGSSVIFGRSTVSGVATSKIQEQGFCWSTHPEPTIFDNRTTQYLTNNGRIYRMEGLTPSTVYYIRAYALTKDYAVGYGDILKVITIPRGTIGWSYDNGADAAANERINNAVASAVEYWNTYTSIKGLYLSVHYGSGTPTADCSYGGWMRVGPNSSYQRTGTIMHEMGHAIGVGQHSVWYGPGSPLRENGNSGIWLGDRATAVLRFWDNSTTATMNGDGTHMWPYGVNGAHEDNGSEVLYIANSLITQALGEDGLPPTGGFATPAYVFEQEDHVKYYIKSESDDFGANTSYLTINNKGMLEWQAMDGQQVVANDSAAWYITFNPRNSYYQFKNVSTGRFITYYGTGRNGFRTAAKEVATTNEQFHLMRSRVDKVIGEGANKKVLRGYWIIHPENVLNPTCFVPMANNRTETASFNLANTAENQRWLIFTADEINDVEKASKSRLNTQALDMIEKIKDLAAVPHVEETEGADAALASQLLEVEGRMADDNLTTSDLSGILEELRTMVVDFLAEVTPKSPTQPFDITFFMADPSLTNAAGWSAVPTISNSCGEYYQSAFNFNQTIKSMPGGTYELRVQAFQRPGTSADVHNSYVAGNDDVTAEIYMGSESVKMKNIMADAQKSKQSAEDVSVGANPVLYIPNTMLSASTYFKKGWYDNSLLGELASDGRSLKVGIRSTVSNNSYWCTFDNFRLYFYGAMSRETITDIEDVIVDKNGIVVSPQDVYTLSGVLVRKNVTSLEQLPKGFYIVGGKKVVVQ